MKRFAFFVFVFSPLFAVARSTPVVQTRNMIWTTAAAEYRFRPQWSWVADANFRFEPADGDIFQWCIRSGVGYKTRTGIAVTGGLVYFQHYANPNSKPPRPELRPWEEVSMKINFGLQHVLSPRIRLEQRFMKSYVNDEPGRTYSLRSHRLRARLEYTFHIHSPQPKNWFLLAGDEVMFYSTASGFTALDQNRAWAGVGYKFTEVFSAQLTYMHVFQQRNSRAFDQLHVVRLAVQFVFARKKKEALR